MRLTQRFDSFEFRQKTRHRLPEVLYPEVWYNTRLAPLCRALEAIRAALGSDPAIKILSGYRTPKYNAKIGGARRSQHLAGAAVDIEVAGFSPMTVHDAALDLGHQGFLSGLGLYPGFVHIDVRPGPLVRWRGSRTRT